MKNKKAVYLLLPLTLLVWGIVVYKIFNGLHNDGDAVVAQSNALIRPSSASAESDTFFIHPDYRDPFLSKTAVRKVETTTIQSVAAIKKVVASQAVSAWPPIVYIGSIRNEKSNKQLAMLQVNGLSSAMEAGSKSNGVELVRIFKDSVELRLGNEKRFVHK